MSGCFNYIQSLNIKIENIGGKARGLQQLLKHNQNIPRTYVCTTKAYKKWLESNENIIDNLRKELKDIIKIDKYYIIRSSASLEDSSNHSYAGQFKSIPSIKSVDKVLQSIISVWKSASSTMIVDYNERIGIRRETEIAVIIQEMLEPDFSGVVFTRNPLNGIEEIIIETVSGRSEKILQKGIDPDRWIYRWGKLLEKPEKSRINEKIISKIAAASKYLEVKIGTPLDLEWVYYNDQVWWIQLREITTIDEHDFFSNKISSGYLPGLIKPLIWSINIPLVCSAWINLLDEIMGKTGLKPFDMAHQFYYRAYFNMSELGKVFENMGIPRDSLEIIMRGEKGASIKPKPPLLLYPRVLKFTLNKIFYEKKLEKHLRESNNILKKYLDIDAKNSEDALSIIHDLIKYNKEAAYYVIVSQLLHIIFHKILENRHKKDISELELEPKIPSINPVYALKILSQQIPIQEIEDLTKNKIIRNEKLRNLYLSFIDKFGHLSDSGNDFSEPTWSESPEQVISMIKYHYQTPIKQTTQKIHPITNSWLFKKVTRLYILREKISFNYSKSYGYFRKYFLIIAQDLVKRGIISQESDVFYLEYNKIRDIISNNSIESQIENIIEIKSEMKKFKDILTPSEIYGKDPPPITTSQENISEFKGIPASNGYFKGSIRKVKSIQDFNKVKPGEILVIPFSDISWLPILAKAGAIVSESGGLLCHAAVVAREYKIPAIIGLKKAFNLSNGSEAIVDGYKGLIKIIERN